MGNFQNKVNEVVGDDYFEFTVNLWILIEFFGEKRMDGVLVVNIKMLPYLDMNIYWKMVELKFSLYNKPVQCIKYVTRYSNHTLATLQTIPS